MKNHVMNWNITFDITVDGAKKSFWDLDDATKDFLIDNIKDDNFIGTTECAGLVTDEE